MLGYISWISYIGHINWSNDVELTTSRGGQPRATLPYRLRKVIHLGVKRHDFQFPPVIDAIDECYIADE